MAKPTPKRRRKSTTKRRARKKIHPAVRATKAKKPKGLRARKPRRLKPKSAAPLRRVAKKIGKAFRGGRTKSVASFTPKKGPILTTPTTSAEKEKRLAKIGIRPYPAGTKRNKAQRQRIDTLYGEFAEFAARGAFKGSRKFRIIRTSNKATLDRARKSGMAVYDKSIYVHVAREQEKARLGSFMGEKIIARTYYGKLERIFLGGADTFDRVVRKLEAKPLKPGQMITGAFFGGPTFHRAIYQSVGEFLNYLNNAFVPHLPAGTKPTKRNIARAKAALIKNIAVVQITNPEFADDEE